MSDNEKLVERAKEWLDALVTPLGSDDRITAVALVRHLADALESSITDKSLVCPECGYVGANQHMPCDSPFRFPPDERGAEMSESDLHREQREHIESEVMREWRGPVNSEHIAAREQHAERLDEIQRWARPGQVIVALDHHDFAALRAGAEALRRLAQLEAEGK